MNQSRSPRFPFLPLEEALVFLKKLSAVQTDPTTALTRAMILEALDYSSLHGSAIKTIGALRAYDLLEKAGDGVTISAAGRRLLEESTSEERGALLQRAALSPLTFRMMWRRARHSSRGELKELLLERGFTEPGAKRASKIYRENDKFAGLRDLELEPDLPVRGEAPFKKKAGIVRLGPKKDFAKSAPQGPRIHPNSMTLPLSTGSAIIPKGISETEFENLVQTLRTWKEQLVRKSRATD